MKMEIKIKKERKKYEYEWVSGVQCVVSGVCSTDPLFHRYKTLKPDKDNDKYYDCNRWAFAFAVAFAVVSVFAYITVLSTKKKKLTEMKNEMEKEEIIENYRYFISIFLKCLHKCFSCLLPIFICVIPFAILISTQIKRVWSLCGILGNSVFFHFVRMCGKCKCECKDERSIYRIDE